MPKLLMIMMLSIALSGCASSGSTDAAGAAKTKGSESSKDCQVVKTTGGRLGKKVCAK